MSDPATCDSYIFCSVIYDSWRLEKEQLKRSPLLNPLRELDDEWNVILRGAREAWVSRHGKFTMWFKKFSLAFGALRRTRYKREGRARQKWCHCGLSEKINFLWFVPSLSPLLAPHRFMLKSPFRKASSLSATLESTTLPGRSVLLLERLHQHPSCCLSPNWGQQTSQVLWNNPKKNLACGCCGILAQVEENSRDTDDLSWSSFIQTWSKRNNITTGLCAQCHAKSIPLKPSLVSCSQKGGRQSVCYSRKVRGYPMSLHEQQPWFVKDLFCKHIYSCFELLSLQRPCKI